MSRKSARETEHTRYVRYIRVHASNDRLGCARAAFNWQSEGLGNSRRSKCKDRGIARAVTLSLSSPRLPRP